MKKLLFALVLVSMLFVTDSCNEDKAAPEQTGVVELVFRGSFGNSPLMMYDREYPYAAGMSLRFQLFRFYLSDIILVQQVSPAKKGILGAEIALVDFKDVQSEASAKDGIVIRLENIPAGDYRGLQTGIGISSKLNRTNPGDYDPLHPLSDNYWSAAMGYVFTKIEGNADMNGDGVFDEKLTFHIGGDPFYRDKPFDKAFTVEPDGVTRLEFDVDLRRVLVATPDDFLDFRKVSIDHGGNKNIGNFISDNLANAIRIR
ncbi:MAG TPA: hypothetical protein PKC76_08715 [Saprospiraceae bacterium]|nr:hypothetical protein [Saprospiraceae bacterium]HMP24200.1 hypothetical protein [Saprospiraceae bacterium]